VGAVFSGGWRCLLLVVVLVPGVGFQSHGAQTMDQTGERGISAERNWRKLAAVVFATYWVCRNHERVRSLLYVFGPLMALAMLLAGLVMPGAGFGDGGAGGGGGGGDRGPGGDAAVATVARGGRGRCRRCIFLVWLEPYRRDGYWRSWIRGNTWTAPGIN